jgi:beta-lactamase superfamily II metal-dependent hydrolase
MAARKKTAKKKAAKKKAARKKVVPRSKKTTPRSRKAAPTAGGNGPAGPAGKNPAGLRVRMYRVGFGDFFLVTVPTGTGPKHILIDCGVHSKDTHSIAAAVDHMAQETGKHLALIIVTHRHADHVTGFSKCKDVFKTFTVDRIWMSWYEDPKDSKALAIQSNIAALASQLHQPLAARAGGDNDSLRMVENITEATMSARSGSQNPGAFEVLHGFPNKPEIDYYKAGDTPQLPPSLADSGLTVEILGPPTDRSMIGKTSKKSEEYIAPETETISGPIRPFAPAFRISPKDYDSPVFAQVPRELIENRVADVQPDMLAAQAAMANNMINNQSLVTLFTFKGKTLLFAGDAQWGNWANFMYGGKIGTELSASSKAILGRLDFYKVGHHGSTNATPKDALDAMKDGCVAMCSTEPKAYNLVPKPTLITKIKAKTKNNFARSDQVPAGDHQTVTAEAGKELAKVFTPGKAGLCGYIDYTI